MSGVNKEKNYLTAMHIDRARNLKEKVSDYDAQRALSKVKTPRVFVTRLNFASL